MYASPDQYVPQVTGNRKPLIMWLFVAILSSLFLAAIVAAPIALVQGNSFLGQSIYRAFGHLCHQLPDRSFFIDGQKFAVCARCTGVYAGFAVAVLVYPLFKSLRRVDTPRRQWLFVAAVPLAIDFVLGFFGVLENTHWSRFLTGALLGAVAVLYVLPGLIELSLKGFGPLFRGSTKSSVLPVNLTVGSKGRRSVAPSDYSAPERRI